MNSLTRRSSWCRADKAVTSGVYNLGSSYHAITPALTNASIYRQGLWRGAVRTAKGHRGIRKSGVGEEYVVTTSTNISTPRRKLLNLGPIFLRGIIIGKVAYRLALYKKTRGDGV